MKMNRKHYEYLKEQMMPLVKAHHPAMLEVYLERGLTTKRYRWDLFYLANLTRWACENLYPYLNDEHIDSVLRKITNTK